MLLLKKRDTLLVIRKGVLYSFINLEGIFTLFFLTLDQAYGILCLYATKCSIQAQQLIGYVHWSIKK